MNRMLTWSFYAASAMTLLALSACGGSNNSGAASYSQNKHLSGKTMGGRQAVNGATVVAYAASTTAGGAPTQIGVATTDDTGSFNMTFSPTPSAAQVVYVVSSGGDPGAGANSAATFLSVLGVYGSSSFPNSVELNELTTVASTAQMQHQISEAACSTITDNTQIGTCLALTGSTDLAARAGTVANLVNPVTGLASTFLSGASSSTPQYTTYQRLNTLANVLANCVNSTGSASTACSSLFSVTSPAQDTAYAAWQLAANSTANQSGSAVFDLLPALSVYSPVLSAAPDNWTVGGQRFTYVLNEGNSTAGSVSAFAVNASTGALTSVGSAVATGNSPSVVTVDPTGKFAYVANEGDGTVSAYTIDPATGALTLVETTAFEGNAPAGVTVSPNGLFAYVPNLGDGTVAVYTINPSTGALTLVESLVTGDGPISVTVSANGLYAYVVDNVDGTVTTYDINATTGALTYVGVVQSGSGYGGGVNDSSPIGVTLSANGQYAYVVNPGDDTVSIFNISASTGALTTEAQSDVPVGNGAEPLALTPNGLHAYVVNDYDDTLSIISVNTITGVLTQESTPSLGNNALEAAVSADGAFLYIADSGDNTVLAYTINGTGGLTAVSNSPFATGVDPAWVITSP